MHLITVVLTWSLGVVVSHALPSDPRPVHHSTKKQLREPSRLPRKTLEGDATDLDPAIAYALPPIGLLHQGQGFGFGLGQSRGFEADLAALVSSGLQLQEAHQDLSDPGKRPVLHTAPHQPYPVVFNRPEPAEVQEQPELKVAKAIQLEAHNFVDAPKHYHGRGRKEEEVYKDYAAKYQFGYRVRDLHTGNDFGQTESRDGHMTQGHYHVLLPDGRLQSVNYWSDDSGFHAKVSYEGHAHH